MLRQIHNTDGSYKKKVQNVKGNRVFSEKLGFFLLTRISVAPNLNMSLQIYTSFQLLQAGKKHETYTILSTRSR